MPKGKTNNVSHSNIPYKTRSQTYKDRIAIQKTDLPEKLSTEELQALENYINSDNCTKVCNLSRETIFYTIILFFFSHGIGQDLDWFFEWFRDGYLKGSNGHFGCSYIRTQFVNGYDAFIDKLTKMQLWLGVTDATLEAARRYFSEINETGPVPNDRPIVDTSIARVEDSISRSTRNLRRDCKEKLAFNNILRLVKFFKRSPGECWRACIVGCPCNSFCYRDVFEKVRDRIGILTDNREPDTPEDGNIDSGIEDAFSDGDDITDVEIVNPIVPPDSLPIDSVEPVPIDPIEPILIEPIPEEPVIPSDPIISEPGIDQSPVIGESTEIPGSEEGKGEEDGGGISGVSNCSG